MPSAFPPERRQAGGSRLRGAEGQLPRGGRRSCASPERPRRVRRRAGRHPAMARRKRDARAWRPHPARKAAPRLSPRDGPGAPKRKKALTGAAFSMTRRPAYSRPTERPTTQIATGDQRLPRLDEDEPGDPKTTKPLSLYERRRDVSVFFADRDRGPRNDQTTPSAGLPFSLSTRPSALAAATE